MYRRSRPGHTLSSRPWAEDRTLFMGFLLGSPCSKSGLSSLYPQHWVYLKRAETTLIKNAAGVLAAPRPEHEVLLPLGAAAIRRRLCSVGDSPD